ncbi:MAG: AAA family ATPase [Alphaproteobacteria bacterium]|nr:AAA family ATPase [Alphaproteobacteria bacterium]MCZ6591012.1 AAA family ATPase [Alphaproteobacteria bacterium]MCZ6838184.1 AAA family ATPase [Alphaproteobacteria bacterium]
MLETLAVSNYRSLRDLIVPLKRLNVVTGPNGSGKSNVYRALRLLADTAQGSLMQSLAREGGLESTLWAGPKVRKNPISLRLGFASTEYSFAIDLGIPSFDRTSSFNGDPEIKRECIWTGNVQRPGTLFVDRNGPSVRVRSDDTGWANVIINLAPFDSMMTHGVDLRDAPEILLLREQIRGWRFYDHFRTDVQAPARIPQVGTRTPVLSNDGADLAAAIQTIREIGDPTALDDAIEDAFPGGSVSVKPSSDGRFEIEMQQYGLLRPLKVSELSDGTLRYLLWVAALLSPRPPDLLVLNEPETSLHPDLLEPLARLIAQMAARTQVIVVSHSTPLVAALATGSDSQRIELQKDLGETNFTGSEDSERPTWHWPTR